MIYKLTFLFCLTFSISGISQNDFPKDYFRSPVDFPIYLAGNFGEIRAGHFHAGLDIKTQQIEGKNIYASADGYVSRIKISLAGYGKVVYIAHANGYTTVYAHLQQFKGTIAEYVRKAQYNQEKFLIEVFPEPNEIPIKKADIIALSGNTGGSGGPHLHFEIRETAGSVPVNPLLFGFDIKDNIAPTLKTIAVTPLNEVSYVNNSNQTSYLDLSYINGKYRFKNSTKLSVYGKIGFGLEAIDHLNGSGNRCGVYSIELNKNGQTVYKHEMDRIPYSETRYINAHVDFYSWNKLHKRIQRSFLIDNNKLNIYKDLVNNGNLFFLKDTTFNMHYTVHDAYQNKAEINFALEVKKPDSSSLNLKPKAEFVKLFDWQTFNIYETTDVKVFMPKGVLYRDLEFQYKKTPAVGRSISEVHHIQNLFTPLQSYMTLSIRVDSNYLDKIDKVLIVSLTDKLKLLAAEGGTVEGDFVSVKTRSLGPYCLMIDTVKPGIKNINIYNGKSMANEKTIEFKISDNLSGIKSWNGYIDGKWVLFEYDKKTGILFYNFSDGLEAGSHLLKLVISDGRNNVSTTELKFSR